LKQGSRVAYFRIISKSCLFFFCGVCGVPRDDRRACPVDYDASRGDVARQQARELPSKEQIRKGFEGLTDDRERAIYLLYASSGLRQMEARELNRFQDVDFQFRAVKSKHDTRTKRAGVTFYILECEVWLKKYLDSRRDNSERLFAISNQAFYEMWKKASKSAGVKIGPQILRKWHSTELGELGVPDSYVDVFQGRAPKSVIAKFYTGKELERLKRIYGKALKSFPEL